jgi:hypothetical protein
MAKSLDRALVKEAVEDANALKEAAVETAKNRLIEQLTPGLRKLVEGSLLESVDRYSGSESDYYSNDKSRKWEESKKPRGEQQMADKDKKNPGEEPLDLEALENFFPTMSEDPDPDPDPDPAMVAADGMEPEPHAQHEDPSAQFVGIPQLGEEPDPDPDPDPVPEKPRMKQAEAKKKGAEDKCDDDLEEQVTISDAELKKVYEAALQTEVQVKKGFGDMSKFVDFDSMKADGTGIAPDKSKGEHPWHEEEPMAVKDNIPEGKQPSVQQLLRVVRAGLAENKQLRENLKKAVGMIKQLGGRLHETNLFNAKVLHANRILNGGRLSTEERKVAMESIDRARSIEEVKMVHDAIVSSFKAAKAVVQESRNRPRANVQRRTTSGQPDPKVLRESVDRGSNESFSRMKELAGLVK